MAWSQEEEELAIRLWNTGLSAGELSVRLRKTRNACLGKMHRLANAGDPRVTRKPKTRPDDLKYAGRWNQKYETERDQADLYMLGFFSRFDPDAEESWADYAEMIGLERALWPLQSYYRNLVDEDELLIAEMAA